MSFDVLEILNRVAFFFVPLLFSLCFHEYAHGWMAKRKGDQTAELMGRLTLNPMAHADPLGTFIIPLIGIIAQFPIIGWAKPVPVNPSFLRDPKRDMFWVAIAGPLSNVLLALIFVGVFGLLKHIDFGLQPSYLNALGGFLEFVVLINLILFFINMIPIHPLDGGKVLERFLPYEWNSALLKHQGTLHIILIVLFFTGGFRYILAPIFFLKDLLLNLV